jgi:RNA polymerase sigma-70 factor, ECF subfamily
MGVKEQVRGPATREPHWRPSFRRARIKTPLLCQKPAIVQPSLGRPEEFDNLLTPHLNSLRRLVRARAKDWSEADDVVQETLLRAFRHLAQLRDKAHFKPWLFRIAMNEIRQRRRSERCSPILVLADPIEGIQIADTRRSAHAECERAELKMLVREALSKLPEKYRSVLELRDLSDLSVSETAQRLCLGVAATKTRHVRARSMLMRSLRKLVARRSRATDLEQHCRYISTNGSTC